MFLGRRRRRRSRPARPSPPWWSSGGVVGRDVRRRVRAPPLPAGAPAPLPTSEATAPIPSVRVGTAACRARAGGRLAMSRGDWAGRARTRRLSWPTPFTWPPVACDECTLRGVTPTDWYWCRNTYSRTDAARSAAAAADADDFLFLNNARCRNVVPVVFADAIVWRVTVSHCAAAAAAAAAAADLIFCAVFVDCVRRGYVYVSSLRRLDKMAAAQFAAFASFCTSQGYVVSLNLILHPSKTHNQRRLRATVPHKIYTRPPRLITYSMSTLTIPSKQTVSKLF